LDHNMVLYLYGKTLFGVKTAIGIILFTENS